VIVSHQTFDRIKPGMPTSNEADLISNLIIVQLDAPKQWQTMATTLASQVEGIQAVDLQTAYENTPGYSV